MVIDVCSRRGDDVPREVGLARAIGADSIELVEVGDLTRLWIFDGLCTPEEHKVFGQELILVGDG